MSKSSKILLALIITAVVASVGIIVLNGLGGGNQQSAQYEQQTGGNAPF